ncbi:MAG: hypothetical protein ABFD24_06075 [Anaerolineaceae bacterium]
MDPREVEKHAKHHVAMGEVGPKITTRLLIMGILLGPTNQKEEEKDGTTIHSQD